MTDNELRALRDANRSDELLVGWVNRLIRCRRNLENVENPDRRTIIQGAIDRLEAKITHWRREHLTVVSA